MFCHHCGSQVADEAASCIHCGARLQARASTPRQAPPGMMFCRNCAAEIPREAVVCVHCGVAVAIHDDPFTRALFPREGRSWVVTLLLALFFGPFGFHRIYTGRILSGLLQLVTFGGFFVWWLFDVARLLMGTFTDAEGRQLVR